MKSKIKVGSEVIVINPGKTYSTNDDMFRKMGFKNKHVNSAFRHGEKGIVFSVEPLNPNINGFNFLVYGIRDKNGYESLISGDGIVLANPSESRSDKEFDLLKAFCVEMELDVTSEDIFKYLLRQK